MLQSRFDPKTGKIVYGKALEKQYPGQGIQMPDGSTQTYVPSAVTPDPNPEPGASVFAGQPAAVTMAPLSVTAPAAAPQASGAGGGMMQKPYGQFLSDLEKSRGLPDGYLARTRAIESSNGTRLQNPNSSASGPFQFIKSTAQSMGLKDPMDPYASATAAADLAKGNAAYWRNKTGQDPSGADLYGMHQQGPAGYLGLTQGQRTGDAAMSLNGGAGLSGSGMVAKIHGLYNGAKPGNLGEGFTPPPRLGDNQGQGPQNPNYQPAQIPAPSAATPAAPDPAQAKFSGGLFGLMQGDDYKGAGAGKDTMGKLGDIFGDGGKGSPIGGAIAGLTQALAGGQQQQQSAPAPLQPLPDLSNAPNMQYMQMLMQRRGIGGGIG